MKIKNNSVVILLGACVAANLMLVGVVWYAFSTIQDLSQSVVALEKRSLNEAIQTKRIRSIEENVRELQPIQDQVEEYFVTEENSIAFVEYVESLSDVAGVESSITIREENEGLRLSVLFQGGFDEGMHYVALLESIPYNTSVQSVHIEEVSDGSWRGGLTVMMPGSGE